MTSENFLLFGNVTIDINETETGLYRGAGGSTYFIAKILGNLKQTGIILSPRGGDFTKDNMPGFRFLPDEAPQENTLQFHNQIQKDNTRIQFAFHVPDNEAYSLEENLALIPSDISAIAIAPVIDNITAANVKNLRQRFPHAYITLLPQGFFRKIQEASGRVEKTDGQAVSEIASDVDAIVVSEQDGSSLETRAEKWSRIHPTVIVTRSEKPCSVYTSGNCVEVPAFHVDTILDSTGAGDKFAAGFMYSMVKTRDVIQSVQFAHAVAGFTLRFLPNQLQYTKEEILSFASSQGVTIKI